MSTALAEWPRVPIRVERIGAERGISGAVYRVSSDAGGTAIVKLPIAGSPRSLEALKREALVYLRPGARRGLRSPDLLYAAADDGAPVVVLEDVGHLRSGDDVEGCSLDDAAVALTALGRFHRAWSGSPEAEALVDEAVVARFDVVFAGLREAMAGSIDPGRSVVQKLTGTDGVTVVEALGDKLDEVAALGGPPWTLAHRDYRLDNLFFADDDRDVVAVDWANLCVANGALDVGGFVGRCLRESPSDEDLMRLIETYSEAAGVHALNLSPHARLGGWYWFGWALIVSTTMELGPGPRQVVEAWIRRLTPYLASDS